ncbi:MAG: type II 3-dehydroquinate dehydratase [bacterium]
MPKTSKPVIAVLNGPNLNLLGERQRSIYGKVTLGEIRKRLEKKATQSGVALDFYQTNSEGELVSKIQSLRGKASAIIINPAAYTHTSVAVRDAIAALDKIPVIEVHLSNIYRREDFRHHSYVSGVATGQICGFGPLSYELAFDAALKMLK